VTPVYVFILLVLLVLLSWWWKDTCSYIPAGVWCFGARPPKQLMAI